MKLSVVTYDELVANGVDMGKLGECVNSASEKRTVKNEKFTQSGKAFTRSESAAISRAKLSDPEDLALTIVAFDTAMLKVQKTWGLEGWSVPEAMVAGAKSCWPFVKPNPASQSEEPEVENEENLVK